MEIRNRLIRKQWKLNEYFGITKILIEFLSVFLEIKLFNNNDKLSHEREQLLFMIRLKSLGSTDLMA